VESTEGEGTIFTIKIPYLKATPMPFDNPETIMANYRIPSKSKILVVEDQLMNQEMIRALFAELGSEILLASNGREGVAMAEQYDPDIIFMDIHMPEIDGFETLKLIRGFNLDIPIIGLSADAFKEHQDAAVEAGFTAYLTKPVNVPKLVGLLKSFLPEVSCTKSTGKTVLNDDQQHQKEQALETLRKLPIFETEKLAAVAESLSEILPAGILNKLEDAIYTGDEVALQNFLTNTLNV
jgi:CheY-like chemotaxis protein